MQQQHARETLELRRCIGNGQSMMASPGSDIVSHETQLRTGNIEPEIWGLPGGSMPFYLILPGVVM